MSNVKNTAIKANDDHRSAVENASDYVENFDILETINNVGNDEVFTPRKICSEMLDSLPEEVWHNKDYKWLNPCTKNGVFEREIAIRLDEGLKSVIPNEEERRKHILTKMIFSIGLTKFTSHVARRTLYYCTEANRKCDGIKASDGHYVNGYAIGNGTWFDTEEGNILTPCTDHEFEGSGENAKCKYCGIKRNSSYVDPLQREQYAYEFIHVNHLVLQKHLQKRFFGGNKDMKFDIIIGNPPYQLTDGGGTGSSARPIYQKFINQARYIKPSYLCMIIPSRWMTGGKGLDDFRKECLNDNNFLEIHDYENDKEVFPNADIGGGVMWFVWKKDYNDNVNYFIHKDNKITVTKRPLNTGASVVVRDFFAAKIIEKIDYHNSFSSVVSSRKPYGIGADVYKKNKKWFTDKKDEQHKYKFYMWDGVPMIKYIENSKLFNIQSANKFKVFISKTGDPYMRNGRINKQILRKPFLGDKETACSETYLVIGSFDTQQPCMNIIKYLSTKFVRFLVLQKKKTQNVSKDVFEFVPYLDFSTNRVIDWSKDVDGIDTQLFDMYRLSEEQISYIKATIDPLKINDTIDIDLDIGGNDDE